MNAPAVFDHFDCFDRLAHREASDFYKYVFSKTADGADPVVRNILESGAGGDAVIRIAQFRVVDVAARLA